MIFIKKLQILEDKNFHFVLLHLTFWCYYCPINLERQSEHSGLRPNTSSLVNYAYMYLDKKQLSIELKGVMLNGYWI